MRNKKLKVAKWEIKRNLQNKTFIISTFVTPAIFLFFLFIGSLVGGNDEPDMTEVGEGSSADHEIPVYVTGDEEAVESFQDIALVEAEVAHYELFDGPVSELEERAAVEAIAYVHIEDPTNATLVVSEEYTSPTMVIRTEVEQLLQSTQLEQVGVEQAERELVLSTSVPVQTISSSGDGNEWLEDIIPAAFAGIVLLSIIMTGMMTLNSSMQEKKDKMAETLLSSVSANQLMQGKILGYFVVGMAQVAVWLLLVIPFAEIFSDFTIIEHLFTPITLLYLLYAVLGYLLFASMYVALGATMEDASTASNLTGMMMMLPFLPFALVWVFISDPNGIVSIVASYFPFSASAAMIVRIVMLDELPVLEIVISILVLVVFVWLMMNAAGKVYRTAMLMSGKNVTPGEIIRMIRHKD
ncbi:ABC transporter permease [Geomicrobium sediminis]|uniref:ABC-2 type transport system permease protein n=1 Tax=Geomicrobium sediminis TaxID=1347788 RepID=A0ABS2P955_9BACL|nr:ABC transporter permease [Geomicrobium sediminis]MBM7631938.1 ABC-2 type transport system permease protein [Geomicrobium sediminis]